MTNPNSRALGNRRVALADSARRETHIGDWQHSWPAQVVDRLVPKERGRLVELAIEPAPVQHVVRIRFRWSG